MKSVNVLKIYNQFGPIDQGTGFLPFGFQVDIGSYLDIEFSRMADIKSPGISLRLIWLDLPENFGKYFQGYQVENGIDNHSFYVDFYLKSGDNLQKLNDRPMELFDEDADKFLKSEKVFDLDFDPKWIYSENYLIRMVLVGGEFAFGHKVFEETLLKASLCVTNGKQPEFRNPPFIPKVEKLNISVR